MTEVEVAIIAIAISVMAPLFGYFYKNRRESKTYYSIIWKHSKSIKL